MNESPEQFAEEYVSKLENVLETEGPPFDEWEHNQIVEHFLSAITKATEAALHQAADEARRIFAASDSNDYALCAKMLQPFESASRAAPASAEQQDKLKKAAEFALGALKQLDLKPMNCRAYIRDLEEALSVQPQKERTGEK